jgi:hypothetical protein
MKRVLAMRYLYLFGTIIFALVNSGCDKSNPASTSPGTIVVTVSSLQGSPPQPVRVNGVVISTNSPTSGLISYDAPGQYRIKDVPPGTYTVKASKNQFQDAQTTVTVKNGETSSATLSMTLLTSHVKVIIEPHLAGRIITIYIDGELLATTQHGNSPPAKMLPVGNHTFRATSGTAVWGPTTYYVNAEERTWTLR